MKGINLPMWKLMTLLFVLSIFTNFVEAFGPFKFDEKEGKMKFDLSKIVLNEE